MPAEMNSQVTLNIELRNAAYPVYIGRALLNDQAIWAGALGPGKVLVVTDENVAPLFLDALQRALGDREAATLVMPAGEAQKSIEAWCSITDRLVAIGALRDATIVALGGGMIGDLAGFAAATYMRGIRFVQAPTTLLAQVDASVGGKTAINHPAGKNLVGAFHQPSAVIIDVDTLTSLPSREFRSGLAEVAKYGIIRDAPFFDWLAAQSDAILEQQPQAVLELIARSVRNKAEVVSEDEKEQGVRALLNFGHSFGHALETLTGYTRYLHGEAVAIGMVTAAALSEQRGLCPQGCADRIEDLLRRFGLPVEWPADVAPDSAFAAMALDKKALDSGPRLILIEAIGRAVIDQASGSRDIVRAIESTTQRQN